VSVVPDHQLTSEQVIAHCREHLGGYKVPKRVVVLYDLPKSGTGKINKRALRDQLWGGQERRV
jgi:acyl-CoA synthetase (AMP-forming)/AMP-acid ligase II